MIAGGITTVVLQGLAGAALVVAAPALAATTAPQATFVATANQPLQFGTVVTAGSGSRTVGPDGSTSNAGIFPLGDRTSGPASFTMTYTPASGAQSLCDLRIQIILQQPATQGTNGITATVSNFTTDIPTLPTLPTGLIRVFTLPNCGTTTCSITFHVGGTLTISGGTSPASLTFPLVLLTSVTTVLG